VLAVFIFEEVLFKKPKIKTVPVFHQDHELAKKIDLEQPSAKRFTDLLRTMRSDLHFPVRPTTFRRRVQPVPLRPGDGAGPHTALNLHGSETGPGCHHLAARPEHLCDAPATRSTPWPQAAHW